MKISDLPEKFPDDPDGPRFMGVTEHGFLTYTIQVNRQRHAYTFAPEMWPHITQMIVHMDGWMKANPEAKSLLTKPVLSGHVTDIDNAVAPIEPKHNDAMKAYMDRLEQAIERVENGQGY